MLPSEVTTEVETETVRDERTEREAAEPKALAPLFARFLRPAKTRTGLRAGLRNMA